MENLKQELIEIRKNDYNFTDYDLDDLSFKMMKSIGTTDSELRDGLIYTTFGQMIIIQDLLRPNQLSQLLKICLNDYNLFKGIGEKETDSVFGRSFSVLVVALILNANRRHSFLSESEVIFVKEQLFTYIETEKDIRGFVSGKGWAHSLAHASDALGEIARDPFLRENELMELLDVIKTKVLYSGSVYNYNEDERMAAAVLQVFERRLLNEQQILNWIGSFQCSLEERKKLVSDPDSLNIMLNVRNFLYSLYFRLRFKGIDKVLQEEIIKTLDSIREF